MPFYWWCVRLLLEPGVSQNGKRAEGVPVCACQCEIQPLRRTVRARAVLPRRLRDTNGLGGVAWMPWNANQPDNGGQEKWPWVMWLAGPPTAEENDEFEWADKDLTAWVQDFLQRNKAPLRPKMSDVMAQPLSSAELMVWIDHTIGECAQRL